MNCLVHNSKISCDASKVCTLKFPLFSWDPLSSFINLNSRKTRYTTIFNFPMESCKPRIGKKKIRFAFRSKTCPKNDALTQKRNIVEHNCCVTKQSLGSIPSMKVRGHFGNVFVKPSAVYVLITILLLITS